VIEGDGKMKIGLIRCLQTEDMCGTTLCLKAIKEHMGAFQDIQEEIELMNINTCGGCPGKKAITRAENMVKNGCDTIVLSSCITQGSPIGFPCPNKDRMLSVLRKRLRDDIRILTYSH